MDHSPPSDENAARDHMRVTVLHRGVPIGAAELAMRRSHAIGRLRPLPGYDAIRLMVRDASRARTNFGYMPPGPGPAGGVNEAGEMAARAAFDRVAALSRELELRDERGALIPTEQIWLFDWGRRPEISLVADLSTAEAATSARIHPRPHDDAGSGPAPD